ncbi:hypothetical protein N7535_001600 [Penicillium sp. DV-2018c]|nr:hypothetical protein N7535_001600 [Penicillium sp. DV-2018c]
MPPSPLQVSPTLQTLLNDLHNKSLTQESTINWLTLPKQCTPEYDTIMADKFIALTQPKCEFVYQLLRSTNAQTVVEAGTGFGVSTIYLALAVAENAERMAATSKPRVIATENEVTKAERARGYWASAGGPIEEVIELRVGDLRETLRGDLGFWTPLALPVLKLVQPFLRPGAVIVVDNTVKAAHGYAELFSYLDAEGSGFRRVTMPYEGGLNHLALRIKDPTRSLHFYIDLLGMRVIFTMNAGPFTIYYLGHPPPEANSSEEVAAWAKRTSEIPSMTRTSGLLELYHVHGSESVEESVVSTGNVPPNLGFAHLGFTVPDVGDAGVVPLSEWEEERGVGVGEIHGNYAWFFEKFAMVVDPVSWVFSGTP